MDCKDTLQLVVALAICLQISSGQSASFLCKQTNVTGSEFEVVFKYFRGGNIQVTGLKSYDASVSLARSTAVEGAVCSTQTLTGDIFTLQYAVDVDTNLPCGIFKDPASPSLYRFAILADGNATVYTFACNVSELQLPNEETVDSFATAHVMNIGEFKLESSPDAKLEVVTPDGRAVSAVKVAERVKLRFSYKVLKTNKVQDDLVPDTSAPVTLNISDVPDNFGTVFHTAFPLTINRLDAKIYTLSENFIDVEMTFGRDMSRTTTIVQTIKSSPGIYNETFNYAPSATISRWPTIGFGLKAQSLGEEIAVILSINSGQYTLVLQPDDVLGKDFRPYTVDTFGRCIISATEDNTGVSFDVSNFGSNVDIAGTLTYAGSTNPTTVVINEFEAIEIMCSSQCHDLPIKSNESVSVLCSDRSRVIQIPEKNKLYREFIIHQTLSSRRRRFIYLQSGDISTDVNYTLANTTRTLAGDNELKFESTTFDQGKYLSSTDPILVVQESFHATATARAFIVAPGIIQWSTRYYFFLESGVYTILAASAESAFDSITIITANTNVKLSELTGGSTNIVTSELGVSYTDFKGDIFAATTGWYEFNSNGTGAPFGIYVVKHVQIPIPFLPFGMRFPCVNSSTGSIVSCESSPTTTETPVTNSFDIKLKTGELTVSDTNNPSGPNAKILHRQGCSTNEAGSAMPMVSAFKINEKLVLDRVVMETDAFKAFKFRGSRYLYFLLTIEICPADELGNCTASCTGRKKRSTEFHHVGFRLEVTDGIDDDVTPDKLNKRGKRQKPCESTIIYWVPHMILVMIIIVEVVATAYFLLKKWKLKQS